MSEYVPGKGYHDGYKDREQGKPNLGILESSILENHNMYWEEYKMGYAEANRKIIEEARSNLDRKFLVD